MLQVTRMAGQCPYDVREGLTLHREQVDAWRGVHRSSDVVTGRVLGDALVKNGELPEYDPKRCRMHVDATWSDSGGAQIDVRDVDDKPSLWLRVLQDKLSGIGVLCVGNDGGDYHAAITVPLGDLTNADKSVFAPEFFTAKAPISHIRITQPQSFHAPVVITLNDETPLSLPTT